MGRGLDLWTAPLKERRSVGSAEPRVGLEGSMHIARLRPGASSIPWRPRGITLRSDVPRWSVISTTPRPAADRVAPWPTAVSVLRTESGVAVLFYGDHVHVVQTGGTGHEIWQRNRA